ncbi:MAG: hypothetical protein IMW89_09150 [Ktedonobacteraceae bacterium]|nr:hypothetical protein [Ktedonobacteraceae bacterium]
MQWSPITHILTVQMTFQGLVPGITYAPRILTGKCKEEGKDLYTLESLVADAKGVASSTTKVAGVASGIPIHGWHITVQRNASARSNQKTTAAEGTPVDAGQSTQSSVLACMDVINKNLPNRKLAQSVIVHWSGEQLSGQARLSIESGKLAVRVSMSGLTPNATFTGLVMPGSCASEGKALYVLKPLVTDASGNGTALTVIPAVSQLPGSGWSIRYTLASASVAQADPVLVSCGNVVAAGAPPLAST